MEIKSADYIELCGYALVLYYHIKSSITISKCTVRLNSQASSETVIVLSVSLSHIYIANLAFFFFFFTVFIVSGRYNN